MSQQEFELYLSLLGRLLRLEPDQREQIADELRDHFDQRLEELTRLGHSRSSAIQQALEEFGDAAGLAAHFTLISHRRKKRLIMRCTLGTVVAMAAAILLATALWPDAARVPVNGRAVAQKIQEPAPQADAAKTNPSTGALADKRREEVEAKLNTRLKEVDYNQQNIGDVLEFLGGEIGVDILVNRTMFDDLGLKLDEPITLQIRHTDVSARTVLEMCLERLGGQDIGYTIRDGLIYITDKTGSNEIRVYDCRDLIGGAGAAGGMPGAGAMAEMSGRMDVGMGGMPGMSGGLGFGGGMQVREPSGLSRVIVTTIQPESWTIGGGIGSIEEFQGLLIVKHNQAVHRDIEQLLEQIRAVAKQPAS